MNFVLDASLAAAFVFSDEATPETDKIPDSFGQGASAYVPAFWRWEVANLLVMAQRRKHITQADRHRHMRRLKTLPVEIDDAALDEAWNVTLAPAEKHGPAHDSPSLCSSYLLSRRFISCLCRAWISSCSVPVGIVLSVRQLAL